MDLTAAEIAAATAGTVVAGLPTATATSFTIDTRTLVPGACFVAVVANRDGHTFVPAAWDEGATVALVSRPVAATPPPDAAVVVDGDGLAALAALGRAARRRLGSARVVGVTGSAGKTATKDLTMAAVADVRRAHASPGSYNNEAGVPLTLLSAPLDTDVVVTEMGARFAGNLTELAGIARPDIGIVTHVGLAHAGNLGGPDGVAAVKSELVAALPSDGLAILNADCPYADRLAATTPARVLRIGEHADADVRVRDLELDAELRPRFTLDTPWGATPVRLALHGAHHATNAAMAVAAAVELDVPLAAAASGLEQARPAPLRMQVDHTRRGVTLINDTYNSSPTSAAAALRALAGLPVSGRRIAVLGEMLELGSYGPEAHAALGRLAVELGVDLLVVVGAGGGVHAAASAARAGGLAVLEAPDPAHAADAVRGEVEAGDAVLVKASRAIGLEPVAATLQGREVEPA